MNALLQRCDPQPNAHFSLAIEEGEAWFFGDIQALKTAYPHCKTEVLSAYVQDSICETWEKMADAIYPGGSAKLAQKGFQEIGKIKMEWAINIAPLMDPDRNLSPSFCEFRDFVRSFIS